MNNNIKKIFLLTTVILLFIGLSTISATDSADDMTLSTDINTQESTISTDTAAINNIDNNLNTQYAKSDKNIKKDDNITEDIGGNSTYINRINLNNENIGDYFDIDYSEAVTRDTFNDSTILQFDEIIDGVNFWYFNTTASDITITTNNNIVFTDQQFLIESPNVTFKDISFEYTSEFEYSKGIIAEESGFKMENCQVYYDASIIDGELNTILLIKGVNSIIKNSTFDCHIVSTGIDWNPDSLSETAEMPTTVPIVILADNVNITDNVITINEKGSDGSDYPSFFGIYIGGNYINFTRNNISLTGSNGYVYTVYVKGTESKSTSYVTISYNNITGISQHNYTAGVYIDGSNYHDISVINNNIYAVSSKDYKDGMALQDVVYAVAQTNFAYQGGTYREGTGGVYDNSFINNTIIAEGHQVYGFEQYGGDNTLISGNTIMVEGSRAQALGVIGYNTVIEGNSLTAIGDTAEGESSPDYVPAITAGVQVLHGGQTTITNNNINVTAARGILIQDSDNVITNNNITVFDYDYSIETRTNATGNLIENNLLFTDAGNGSKTINDAAGENTIGNNTDLQELIITFIGLDDVVCTLGDEMELFVTIENADEEEQYDYDGQSVILYANGEEIDSQEIEDGFVFFICDVPLSWYKNITLVVNYPGNDECAPAEAEVNLTVNIPTSIQAEDNIIAQPNSQLTSISVIDIMNNTVDAASIDVYENDTLISNLSNYTITGTDSYPIKLVFDGGLLSDGYTYLSSEKEVTITVEQPKPSVNISLDLEDEYKLGDTIEIITGVEDEDEQTIVGLNVDLYCNDEYVTTLVSDEDGCISYDYTPTAVGNYTFTVKVNDDNYASSEATKTVIVNKNIVPVLIMMELDDEYELGNAVDIMANVVDDNYDNVAGVNVDLYIDDEFVASVESDEDGMVSYEYTPTAAGTYVITLKVNDEDFTGEDESAELVVVITPKETSIILADLPQEVYVGDNISISGQVTDENDEAVANASVTVSFDDQVYPVTTDIDGNFIVDIQANNEGTFVITTAFAGNEMLLPSMVNATITVNKKIIPVFVNVDELGAEYELGRAVEVIATVQDVENNPVSGVNVDLYIGDDFISSAVSDDEGVLSYEYIPSAVGNYTLILRVNNENYTGEDYSANFSVYKNIIPVSILVELDDEYELGSAVEIVANVVDDNYDNVAGVNVDLYIDDEFVASVESDEDGMVSYEYTPTAAGAYVITLKVNDEDYTGLDVNASLIVNKIPTATTVEILNNIYGNVTISVTVTDENDDEITQGYIIVTDSEGNVLANANVSSSDNILIIPTETTGQLEVIVTYQENDMYQESNDELVIDVSKLSSYITVGVLPDNVSVGENITVYGELYDEYGNYMVNANVEVIIDGQIYSAVTDASGQYSISIVVSDAGEYNATAAFNGNDIVLPAMNQTTFTVNKIPTKTSVEVINNTLGNVIISVTITDINGQVITTGNVTVNAIDSNITVPIESENTTIQLDITTKTNVTGLVEYQENDNYLASDEVLNLTVIIPTTIETDDSIDVLVNEQVTLNASVVDITNATVDAAVINVYENDTFISDLSSYTFAPTASGSYTIRLVFDGGLLSDGSTYITSEKEVTINANLRQALITVESEDTIENTPTTVTIQLTDVADENIPVYGTVILTDEEGNVLATENVENSTATVQVTFNTTGEHNIIASFNNAPVYEAVNATTTITVNKNIIPVIIYLDVDDEYELGSDVEVTATVEDDNENTVAGVNVDLYCNDEFVTSLVSDENGMIVYEYTPSTYGNYTITLKVNDGNYTANDTTATFTVLQPAKEYSLQVVTKDFTVGETANIQANIYCGNEFEQEIAENITKGKVTFKVNGKVLKDENGKVIYAKIVNGTAIIYNYTIPQSWYGENITIEATYSGSTQCDSLKTDKELINVSKAKPKITTQDINATIGSTVTFEATITDDNQTINTGKVVFKINGKTLKDENGKVIYVQVTNNTASLEYTLPLSYKAKNYTVTAVFTSSEYERMEDSKTLIITND